MEEGFDDSDSAANKVLPTSRRQCRSLCRQDAGSTLRFMEPTTLLPCIGTMNCAADVAQASSPATSPGVSPGVRAGGETPPQLAAGTAALPGSRKAPTKRFQEAICFFGAKSSQRFEPGNILCGL